MLLQARSCIGSYCKACNVCNGKACRNQIPGPGSKGVGDTAIRNYDKWQEIRVNMDTLCEGGEPDTSVKLFGKEFRFPFLAGPVGAVNLHYSDKYDDISYYVPVTKVMNSESEKIDIIIEELKSSVNSQNNFKSYISDNLELVNYTHDESKMSLVFNNYIFNDFDSKNVLEEVKYIIASSVFENYNVNEVVFNTESEENIADILKK